MCSLILANIIYALFLDMQEKDYIQDNVHFHTSTLLSLQNFLAVNCAYVLMWRRYWFYEEGFITTIGCM